MKNLLHTSVRLKLAIFVAAVVALMAGALSLASYTFARKTLRHQIHERLTVLSSDRRKILLEYVRHQQEWVALLASRTRLRQLLDDHAAGRIADEQFLAETKRILLDAQKSSHDCRGIWVTDSSGRAITATDEKILGRDYSATPAFSEGRMAIHVGEIHPDMDHSAALLAAPATRDDGQFLGVMMALMDATPMVQALIDRTGLGGTGEVFIGVPEHEKLRYMLPSNTGQKIPEVPLTDWPAAAEAYAPIAELRRMFIMVEVAIFFVGLVASYLLAWRFTRPILRMSTMAETIATGKLDARVVVEGQDEIGALGRAFNHMTGELAHSYAILEDRVRARTAELAKVNEELHIQIAERKQAEEAIRHAHDLLNSVVENIPDMIFMKEAKDLRFVRFNKAGEELIGRAREEMIGKNDYDFFPKEEADFFTAKDREVLTTGRALDIREEPIQTSRKGLRVLHTKKVPLYDASGKPEYLLGIAEDITNLKRAEEELQRHFTLSLDLFCIADFRGYFQRLNPSWEQVLGYSLPELMAKPFMEFVHPDDREATLKELEKLRQGGRAIQFENRYRRKDGSYCWLQWNSIPVPEQQLIHAVARDVTEHKRAQQLLASFADALKRKNTEMQEDLRMAREIQQTFIPQRYPTFPRHASPAESALRFCHHYQPATTLGGDFFDVFALSDTQVGVFICDVMGHGIRAALLTAIIRGLLQELRPVAADPGQFLTEINLALFASLKSATTTTFASAFYLVIEATTGQMLSANAGHPSPLWLRRDAGTVQPLQESEHAHGPALGFMSEAEYHTSRQRLGPTDAVLLFTDGLYEVEGREGDQFGLSRVQEKVQNCLQRTGSALVNEVVAEIQKFSSSGEFSDDVCLVAVEAVESVVRDSWSRDARSVLRAKP